MDAGIVVAIIAAVAAPLGAYLVAAKRFSGKIESSDAKELWAESRSIRDWSQGRIETLNTDVEELRRRIAALEDREKVLMDENQQFLGEIRDLKETIVELREEIRTLLGQLKESRNRVTELEEEVEPDG